MVTARHSAALVLPVLAMLSAATIRRMDSSQAQGQLSLEDRTGALGAAIVARRDILGDSTALRGCSVWRQLDRRDDYSALMAPSVRSLVDFRPSAACLADEDTSTAALVRLMGERHQRPKVIVDLAGFTPRGGSVIVDLEVVRGQYGFHEWYYASRQAPSAFGLGSWRVDSLKIGPPIIF